MPSPGPGAFRSRALLGTTAALFAVGLILQLWGGANFPAAAPVEEFFSGLIVFDIGVGFLVATTGALIAARDRHPLRGTSALTIVGVILVGVALGGWIWLSGIGIVGRLPTGHRGRYMYDVAGAVCFGIPWIAGTMLCAFGYRRGGSRANAVRGLLGALVGLALLVVTVTSAVLYGLGLTD